MEQTKQELIDTVRQSLAGIILEKEIAGMVIAAIERAHSIGFNEGMMAANKVREQTEEMLRRAMSR